MQGERSSQLAETYQCLKVALVMAHLLFDINMTNCTDMLDVQKDLLLGISSPSPKCT